MDSNKNEELIRSTKPLPRWIRRAFKLKDDVKREKIFIEARDQGYSILDLLAGFEEFKIKRDKPLVN